MTAKRAVYCMDRTGHSTVAEWDEAEADIAAGKKAFAELAGKGFTAFAMPPGDAGSAGAKVEEGRRIDAFDPDVSVVFVPRLVGG